MTPIKKIYEEASASRTIDLEKMAARLKHHEYKISLSNRFVSDCGDEWCCELYDSANFVTKIHSPSLREAILQALEKIL